DTGAAILKPAFRTGVARAASPVQMVASSMLWAAACLSTREEKIRSLVIPRVLMHEPRPVSRRGGPSIGAPAKMDGQDQCHSLLRLPPPSTTHSRRRDARPGRQRPSHSRRPTLNPTSRRYPSCKAVGFHPCATDNLIE